MKHEWLFFIFYFFVTGSKPPDKFLEVSVERLLLLNQAPLRLDVMQCLYCVACIQHNNLQNRDVSPQNAVPSHVEHGVSVPISVAFTTTCEFLWKSMPRWAWWLLSWAGEKAPVIFPTTCIRCTWDIKLELRCHLNLMSKTQNRNSLWRQWFITAEFH